MSTATIEPIQPGSMKDKVLTSILELGAGATTAAISKRTPQNSHLVGLSIDALQRDGYIQITSEGNYELTSAGKKTMRGQSALVPTRPAMGKVQVTDVETKFCKGCSTEKPKVAGFYAGASVCKECQAARTKQLEEEKRKEREARNARMAPSAPARVTPAQTARAAAPQIQQSQPEPPVQQPPTPPPKPSMESADLPYPESDFPPEFVIPAAGSIKCRAVMGALWIIQDDTRIEVKHLQLVALVDWLRGQEKALRGMGVLS